MANFSRRSCAKQDVQHSGSTQYIRSKVLLSLLRCRSLTPSRYNINMHELSPALSLRHSSSAALCSPHVHLAHPLCITPCHLTSASWAAVHSICLLPKRLSTVAPTPYGTDRRAPCLKNMSCQHTERNRIGSQLCIGIIWKLHQDICAEMQGQIARHPTVNAAAKVTAVVAAGV